MCFARAAMTPSDSLPTDPDALRALLLAERTHHAEELERLTAIIKELQRHRFGRRAERLDPEQLALALEDVEQTLAAVDTAAENDSTARKQATPRRRQINRGALPPHLPREEIIIDVADKTCACCGGLKHRIGEDVSERLDVMPAQFKVIVTRRPKYACQACGGEVVQAPAPERLIENGIPTEALVAHVLIAKYADHTPLYRQAQIYARQGITLDRSTLADWVGRAAFTLRSVHTRLLEQLKQSTKLFADETTAPVLDPGRGRVKKGQLWAYARDERPWAGHAPPGVAYVYAPDRKHARPAEHLAGFSGILQVDGYGAYLRDGRPTSSCRRLFLRTLAPNVGFASGCAITMIAKTALERAGIRGYAHQGAHIFRHSLATELLRSGATLSEIGQLLRHESHDTTRIYAKVDIEALRTLSLPWPGGVQ